jgi:mono/diheme cytochrome c family protein
VKHRAFAPAALAAVLLAAGGVAASEPARGRMLYQFRCAACHGADGRGDGPAAAALKPPPKDLTTSAFWAERTPAVVADGIRQGRPGTAMVAYGSLLTDEEIAEIVAYLRHLAGR